MTAGFPRNSVDDLLETVRQVVNLVEHGDASEIELVIGEVRVRARRVQRRTVLGEGPGALPEPLPAETAGHQVRAPLTGIWYDAASTGAPAYVHVGSMVEIGTPIGIIETMKIFNEIASDAAGLVTHIHVHRGELVNIHAPLVTIQIGEVEGAWPPRM